jgi:hypothetical protein
MAWSSTEAGRATPSATSKVKGCTFLTVTTEKEFKKARTAYGE